MDSVMWDDADFESDDPLVRFNAHQAAKGRPLLPDSDELKARMKEDGSWWAKCEDGDEAA